ncbi:Glycerol-3-phosphate dehydrogenase (NAD(P)(+)) [Alkaliphilus metalliredigens QYMF]|uniref:Glycerol-3-phosphate dehydrogenase [NAD(P)+] n=1 Tax=Alkaliphilus metalliredigens (strain QYMF) TaxID=293826 RepID=A6TS37_ALKMQ|nr:NAD(P)H-dependent glycerol-3-phosphate dehydrogenase [Alkaliphilus metalliredigens]ABR49005.1 Glycerol-3-phosphate dehydrogenase (NAD(P)(+)) [Alkaliphilus metalliredigens QYMF]
MTHSSITVLGAGSWGTALSLILAKKGHEVKLWMRNQEQYEEMNRQRENTKYLPGTQLHENIKLYVDIEKAVKGTDVVLLTISSQAVRGVLKNIRSIITREQIIVNAAKGLEANTLLRISQVVEEELGSHPFAVLSGPSHAEEVSKDIPTTVVVAAYERSVAECIQDLFMSSYFRVYTNPDVIGVELGGALKNVIAFGAGISDGLGYGDNAKAALMTRGIREIARLGSAMGGKLETFAGLTGIGDLIVTCTSMHSRNRRAGILTGQGKSLEETLSEIGMVVEGIKTTKAAFELAKQYQIEMPITEEIYSILYKDIPPRVAVSNLMSRDRTHEIEDIVDAEKINW